MSDRSNGTPTLSYRSDAAALFARKLKLAESLSCRQLFADLDEADAAIIQHAVDRIDLEQRLTVAHAQLADAEAMASLAVDGKNETERKARRAEALRSDPAYQSCVAAVREAEWQRATAEVEAEALLRRARRIEKAIEYRSAALRLMGG